uniref:Transcriptional regulator, Cro/CI family n=1 Tax=uncultured bacterium Contig643 TaxID=1393602 RepID=W0FH90_9BACT|nr:transcriptional regulator, Cro/CI family [uncultured bacterium Contig643]
MLDRILYSRLYYEKKEARDMENKLKTIRKAKNLSQAELAEKSGVSRATIANIERGKQVELLVGTVAKLASALDVSISEVI